MTKPDKTSTSTTGSILNLNLGQWPFEKCVFDSSNLFYPLSFRQGLLHIELFGRKCDGFGG